MSKPLLGPPIDRLLRHVLIAADISKTARMPAKIIHSLTGALLAACAERDRRRHV
jgi:hypothetical protein